MDVGQGFLDLGGGLDEIDGVVVMFLDAGGDGEDIGIEDDVFGRESHLLGQEFVGAGADIHLALIGIGLTGFIKGHDHHGGAKAQYFAGSGEERLLPLLQADGIDHPLALQAFEPGNDHRPFG